MNSAILSGHLAAYQRELRESILPFWVARSLDYEWGGYFTCFSNDGATLISTDKYVWSQGRLVWVFAELARLSRQEKYLEYARLGVDFLLWHARLPGERCAFLLSREGRPLEASPEAGLDSSIYADCFVALGLAHFAVVAAEPQLFEKVLHLHDSILARLTGGVYKTAPYPIPRGYAAHGIAMIMLNVSAELRDSAWQLGHDRHQTLAEQADDWTARIFSAFYRGGLLHEFTGATPAENLLLERYINPGHSLECCWFIMHQAVLNQNAPLIERCARIIERVYEVGWDHSYGGLLLFCDQEGGEPKGAVPPDLANHPMIGKVRQDWSTKLWWPHVEALYATLLGWQLTGRPALWKCYEKTREYTFSTFPNPRTEIGEWIQIRDRRGRPCQKIVALPVKDPYHIGRGLLLLIQLINRILDVSDGLEL